MSKQKLDIFFVELGDLMGKHKSTSHDKLMVQAMLSASLALCISHFSSNEIGLEIFSEEVEKLKNSFNRSE